MMRNTMLRKMTSFTVATVLTTSIPITGLTVFAENNNNVDTYSVTGEIRGFSGTDDELLPFAVVSITSVGSKTPEYVTTGIDEFSFDNVDSGEYILEIAARGEYVTHEYNLIVEDSDIVLNTTIHQLGDTNQDGVITEDDCDSLFAGARRDDSLEESAMSDYDMMLADVNYDGIVDEKDFDLIRQYSNGKISAFPRKEIIITEECQKAIDEKLSVDEEWILSSNELIVTFDEEYPLEYFLVKHEVKNYEVFIGENDWGIHPFIQIGFYEDYSVEEEASIIAENDHIIDIHPHYFTEIIDPVDDEIEGEEGLSLNLLLSRNGSNLNDPYFPSQNGYYTDMGLLDAWDLVNENMIRKAKIAVIDCDLDYNHSDLVNVIESDQCFDAVNFECEGEWSPTGPTWNHFTRCQYTPTNIFSNHGTAVTSLIVAEANNQIGLAGAASAGTNDVADVFFYNCAILNQDGNAVLDRNAIYMSIICAIEDNVDVINMSFGRQETTATAMGDSTENTLLNGAYNQGITLIASSGNDGSVQSDKAIFHENETGVNFPHYPSDWGQCIATSSLSYSSSIQNHDLQIRDSKYRRATYSSYNANKDISAYGTQVYYAKSTNMGQSLYGIGSGTSFAAPLLTSIVALMVSVNPMLSNEQIYDILTMTATDLSYSGNIVNSDTGAWGTETAGNGDDIYTGYGMVNASRCVEAAIQLVNVNHSYVVYPQYVSIPTYSSYQLTGQVIPDNLYNNNLNWVSSNSAIASVDQYGVVTAHKYGTVTITSTCTTVSSLSDTVTVQTRYYDVNDISKYYYTPVYWAADNEITRGYNNVYFAPNGTCDRKSIVVFLWRMSGCPVVQGSMSFSDVNYPQTSDTYKAILWASTQGIANGYQNGTLFGPDNPVNRKDAMIMLYRTAGSPAVSGTMPFPDVVAQNYLVNSDSYKSILWAYNTGITHVASGGNFKPLENCIRAEIVTFLYRYVNL